MRKTRRMIRDSQRSEWFDYVYKYMTNKLGYGVGEFVYLVDDLVSRAIDYDIDEINEDNVDEYVKQAMDDGLIYYDDEWLMLKAYCNPKKANYNDAYDELYTDLVNIITNILEDKRNDD